MTRTIAIAFVLCCAVSGAANAQITFETYGNETRGSDGSVYRDYGQWGVYTPPSAEGQWGYRAPPAGSRGDVVLIPHKIR